MSEEKHSPLSGLFNSLREHKAQVIAAGMGVMSALGVTSSVFFLREAFNGVTSSMGGPPENYLMGIAAAVYSLATAYVSYDSLKHPERWDGPAP